IAFLTWLILIILVPELSNKFIENKAEKIRSIEKMNIQKLSDLMDYEKKSLELYLEKIKDKTVNRQKLKREILAGYMDTGYKANEELENVLFNEVEEMIFFVEKFSLIAPTTYYSFLSKEIAGEGYYSDLAFYGHIIQLKRKFMKFIIDNRSFSVRRKVEPFVRDNENIFQASSHLPRTFAAATGMNLFYMVLMLFFIMGKARVYLRENGKKGFEGPFEFDKVNVGEIHYVFCGSEEKRDKLFDSLKGGETIAMEGVSPHDFDGNIKLKDLLHLAVKIEGTHAEKAAGYMQQLGTARESLTKKIEEVPAETFKKFFCALKLAGAQNYIIISDYAAGAGKEFNQKFRNLLAHINKEEGKTILYLSGEMFDTLSYHQKAKETGENSEYKLFKLDDITAIAL
ncbi:MAG: hypothetical protein GY950_26125, partial [bacterium]|nr:hypothetical protein [bacterium]